jgi:DNA-binding protein YbaB
VTNGVAPKDLEELLRTAGRLQAEVAKVKDALEQRRVDGESGGGLVRCVVSGGGDLLSLTLDPALSAMGAGGDAAANLKMIEDLTVAAINQAITRARDAAQDEMARVTGGLPMPPGIFGS